MSKENNLGKKIFAKKELTSLIYKEYLDINRRKPQNPVGKQAKSINRYFTEKYISQMAHPLTYKNMLTFTPKKMAS